VLKIVGYFSNVLFSTPPLDHIETNFKTLYLFVDTGQLSQSETQQQGDVTNLLRLISRPRDTASRVSNAVQLVEALRRIERVGEPVSGSRETGQPVQVFVALALRELDELIDRMSYEELLQAFGDRQFGAGINANDLNSIPVLTCSHTEAKAMAAAGDSCSVCLDCFSANQTLRKLGCCHAFHSDCIDPWLRKKADCPVCRRPVKPANAGGQ
jgi:hypothetical protein